MQKMKKGAAIPCVFMKGKQQVVDWINAQYEDHPEKWSHEKKNLY